MGRVNQINVTLPDKIFAYYKGISDETLIPIGYLIRQDLKRVNPKLWEGVKMLKRGRPSHKRK